jgi:site-specific recombinase XerC
LIARHRDHAAFQDLAPRTKADYQRCLDYLKPIADTPLNRFTPPLVVRIRDKAAEKLGRKWGNYTKTVLSVVFGWGVERGYMATNPAFKIRASANPRVLPRPTVHGPTASATRC